jgi:hypothetical protein
LAVVAIYDPDTVAAITEVFDAKIAATPETGGRDAAMVQLNGYGCSRACTC